MRLRLQSQDKTTAKGPGGTKLLTMSAQAELFSALKETLQRTGTLESVTGILRAEIFHCLNDTFPKSEGNKTPAPPKENILINEIIADYLAFNGYFNTLSVLAAESGTPSLAEVHENGSDSTMLGSNFIRAELGLSKGNIISGRRRTPLALLYEIIETLKTINRSRAKTS